MMSLNSTRKAVLECRCSYTELATILRFYLKDASRAIPRTKSGVVNMVIADFYDLLIKNNLVEPITEESDAIEMFASLGFSIRSRGAVPSAIVNAYRNQLHNEMTMLTEPKTQEQEEAQDISIEESINVFLQRNNLCKRSEKSSSGNGESSSVESE